MIVLTWRESALTAVQLEVRPRGVNNLRRSGPDGYACVIGGLLTVARFYWPAVVLISVVAALITDNVTDNEGSARSLEPLP